MVVNDHLLLYRFSGKKCNICATYFLSNNLSFWHVERMKKKFQFTISLPVYYYTSFSSFFLEIQSNKNHLCSKCHKNILWLLWNLQRGGKKILNHTLDKKKIMAWRKVKTLPRSQKKRNTKIRQITRICVWISFSFVKVMNLWLSNIMTGLTWQF